MSVRPPGTTKLPLERVSVNSVFEYFSKIYQKNSFIEISQE